MKLRCITSLFVLFGIRPRKNAFGKGYNFIATSQFHSLIENRGCGKKLPNTNMAKGLRYFLSKSLSIPGLSTGILQNVGIIQRFSERRF